MPTIDRIHSAVSDLRSWIFAGGSRKGRRKKKKGLSISELLQTPYIPIVQNDNDLETGGIRSYYPDFLTLNDDGTYTMIEVKGDNVIEDKVVRAKRTYAEQIAQASGMEYVIIKGSDCNKGIGIHNNDVWQNFVSQETSAMKASETPRFERLTIIFNGDVNISGNLTINNNITYQNSTIEQKALVNLNTVNDGGTLNIDKQISTN